jgi:hypothetical protein
MQLTYLDWAFRVQVAGLIRSDGARREEGSTPRSGRETASRFANSGYGSLEIRCKDQAIGLERACHASRRHN